MLDACIRQRGLSADAIYGEAAEEIGQGADGVAFSEYYSLEDAQAELGAEGFEVDEGAVVDVGGVVPLVREFLRYRHVTLPLFSVSHSRVRHAACFS